MALEQVNPDALRSFAGKVSGSVTKILDHIEAQPPPRKRAAAIQELGSRIGVSVTTLTPILGTKRMSIRCRYLARQWRGH
ncbi:MAG: hypothetical protein ACJAR0_003786 [Candidatus Azotimanducaceae bacterium]|jgi:hypothetical protein